MSVSYFLCCMDCKTGVRLGKSVYTYHGTSETRNFGFFGLGGNRWKFDGINEAKIIPGPWKPNVENLEVLAHFLILHRGHHLRVLPSLAEKYASQEGFPQSWPSDDEETDPDYNRLEFLRQPISRPNPEKELEDLPPEVIEILKTF